MKWFNTRYPPNVNRMDYRPCNLATGIVTLYMLLYMTSSYAVKSLNLATTIQNSLLLSTDLHVQHKPVPKHTGASPDGLRRSLVHSLMIVRHCVLRNWDRILPGQGSKGITFSGWHGIDMSVTVTKGR